MLFQKTFEKLGQEVKDGAANWDMMTNRYFDTVEQQDILNKADQFLSEVRFETFRWILDSYTFLLCLK